MTSLRARFDAVRADTLRLAAPLSPEDCQAQSMPDASPVKWHLAHSSWFFETFVLGRPSGLFNSYYRALGEPYPRAARGLLTRPSLRDVLDERVRVDAALGRRLEAGLPDALAARVELGLQHEQQHQELLLTDAKHLLSRNPSLPAYVPAPAEEVEAPPLEWLDVPGGLVEIGDEGRSGFAFDNERPRHRRHLEPFRIASRPVTCGEVLAFVEDGGYARPELWMSDGWDVLCREGWTAPLYWTRGTSGWSVFTLAGPRPLDPRAPACHLSWYEADAVARWAGARLPGEDEWEVARVFAAGAGPLRLHPSRAGDVWEWTASPYAPYPGYRPPAGPIGEYNGKFMCNRFVLRGGSCATPRGHVRPTYRNFFPPEARWQFSGLRLAL